MERILHLVERLVEQMGKGENTAQLLNTVQQLHQELLNRPQVPIAPASTRVAVVMPGNTALQPVDTTSVSEQKPLVFIPEEDKRFMPKDSPVLENIKQVIKPELKKEEQFQSKTISVSNTEATPKYNVDFKPKDVFALSHEDIEDAPTLRPSGSKQKEVHDTIAEKKESLNDLLKQEKLELGNMLKDTPIKDLRKGIGVNDKFLFISELFRGDEDMYERSIKTINGFRILPEAEYWINRELKVKQGWNDSKDTVQHFYAIVRRRFS